MTETKKRTQDGVSFCLLALLALCLILQSTLHQGIKDALRLCYTTVIPSLFPFMVLSDALRMTYPKNQRHFLSRVFSRLFATNEYGFYPFFMGAICGFPVGAKEVCALYQEQSLSKEEAHHLLGFVNLSSPAFVIFGIGASMRGSIKEGIALYLIQLLSAFLVARVTAPRRRKPNGETEIRQEKVSPPLSFPRLVTNSTLTMLSLCGMICTFSAIASLFSSFLPSWISVYLVAFLEIVNGTKAIFAVFQTQPLLSFALTACAISFAGLSVHMQANLFILETDLSFWLYVRRKLLGAVFSFALALCYGFFFMVR